MCLWANIVYFQINRPSSSFYPALTFFNSFILIQLLYSQIYGGFSK